MTQPSPQAFPSTGEILAAYAKARKAKERALEESIGADWTKRGFPTSNRIILTTSPEQFEQAVEHTREIASLLFSAGYFLSTPRTVEEKSGWMPSLITLLCRCLRDSSSTFLRKAALQTTNHIVDLHDEYVSVPLVRALLETIAFPENLPETEFRDASTMLSVIGDKKSGVLEKAIETELAIFYGSAKRCVLGETKTVLSRQYQKLFVLSILMPGKISEDQMFTAAGLATTAPLAEQFAIDERKLPFSMRTVAIQVRDFLGHANSKEWMRTVAFFYEAAKRSEQEKAQINAAYLLAEIYKNAPKETRERYFSQGKRFALEDLGFDLVGKSKEVRPSHEAADHILAATVKHAPDSLIEEYEAIALVISSSQFRMTNLILALAETAHRGEKRPAREVEAPHDYKGFLEAVLAMGDRRQVPPRTQRKLNDAQNLARAYLAKRGKLAGRSVWLRMHNKILAPK